MRSDTRLVVATTAAAASSRVGWRHPTDGRACAGVLSPLRPALRRVALPPQGVGLTRISRAVVRPLRCMSRFGIPCGRRTRRLTRLSMCTPPMRVHSDCYRNWSCSGSRACRNSAQRSWRSPNRTALYQDLCERVDIYWSADGRCSRREPALSRRRSGRDGPIRKPDRLLAPASARAGAARASERHSDHRDVPRASCTRRPAERRPSRRGRPSGNTPLADLVSLFGGREYPPAKFFPSR